MHYIVRTDTMGTKDHTHSTVQYVCAVLLNGKFCRRNSTWKQSFDGFILQI